jgi:polysaccharide deacetylase family protein (PEP-CTERM system associated)
VGEQPARLTVADREVRQRHLLTFDVEHWYEGYRLRGFGGWDKLPARDPATVARLLELLAEHNQRATFFATGRFASEFPAVVRSIAAAGHEIASHGFDHIPIHRLGGPVPFREDLRRSLGVLHALTDQPVLGYRAPCWSIRDENRRWVLETLAVEGLAYDSSAFAWGLALGARARTPTAPHRVSLTGGRSIWEVPPGVLSLWGCRLPAAGGFYLRFFPEAIVRAALHQATAASHPGLIYLHPYDMDADCPRLPARWYFTLMRYYRLGRTEGVLRRLLRSFQFTSIRDWLVEQRDAA